MNQLGGLHRRSLYATGAVLLASGLAWAVLHYLPRRVGVDEHVARAAAAALMKVHGAAAMLALLLLGALRVRHVVHGWKRTRNRWTGSCLALMAAILVVTGYLLYYVGDEGLRAYASWIHLVVGAALPVPVIVHVLRLLRLRSGSRTPLQRSKPDSRALPAVVPAARRAFSEEEVSAHQIPPASQPPLS